MGNVTTSLFGIDPQQIAQQRQQQDMAESFKYAQLDPFQQATASIYQGAKGLGRAAGGFMGGGDPELQKLAARKQLLQGIDFNDAQALNEAAQRAVATGDYQLAQELSNKAQDTAYKNSQITKNLRDTTTARVAADSNDVKNARAWAATQGEPGTPEYQKAYVDKLDELTSKADPALKTPAYGAAAEILAKRFFGKLFKDLTPEEAAKVDSVMEQRDQTTSRLRGGPGNQQLTYNMLGKEPKDIPEFRSKVQGTLKPYRDAIDSAEVTIVGVDEAIKTGNFAALQVALRNLVKSSGDSQIAAKEVSAAGGDPSIVGGGVDYVSKLFTGTPSRDTMNKIKKTAEVLRDLNAKKLNRELTTQRNIAGQTYKPPEVDLIFDGFGPTEITPAATPAAPKGADGGQTSKGTKYRIIE